MILVIFSACSSVDEKESRSVFMASPNQVRKFCESTTCHGFREIVSSQGLYHKIFWCCLVVLCLVCAIQQAHVMMVRFLTYPAATKMSTISVNDIEMPVITVCNLNRLNRTYIREKNIRDVSNISRERLQPELSKVMIVSTPAGSCPPVSSQ